MGLSCSCGDDYDWYYWPPEDFTKLKDRKRRPRCVSCGNLVDFNLDCLQFYCFREPNCDYEENRFGDEVPMAPKYMCESCGETFLNLMALGYCITLGDNMRELLKDYWDMTGFDPTIFDNQTLQGPAPLS